MKQPSTYLKMRVLGALDTAEGKTRDQRVRRVAEMIFIDEYGNPRTFTWRTIQTWHYRYKNYGITGMTSQPRRDKGQTRKVTPEELLEAINAALPHFRQQRFNKIALYRFCIEKGLLQKSQIAQTTFFRFVREYELLFEENIDSLVEAIRAAFYKRGIPEQLYVDNGSIYATQEITLICARVGCILRHTAVRDAAAKGKIERFFRRVRDQFLTRQLDLTSLDALNRQFTIWVENEYNATEHSALGMKPIDRFGLDLKRIRFLPPSEVNDELFFAAAERKVKKDNTFSFQNTRYETPVDLSDKPIQIRYERHHAGAIVVYYNGQRMGLLTCPRFMYQTL